MNPQTRSLASTLPESKWWLSVSPVQGVQVSTATQYCLALFLLVVWCNTSVHWNNDTRLLPQHHYHEPGSTFSMHFSNTARLTGSLNHPHLLLFSCWKKPWLPSPMAPVFQPSDGPVPSMGLVPTACLQEPRTGQCFSCSLRSAEQRECSSDPCSAMIF